jgi:hypothetical protein
MFGMSQHLEQAISRFRKTAGDGAGEAIDVRVSAAAFRATVEQWMASVERDIGEVKGRLNGLIFVVIGAVITQLILRVMA